MIMFSAPKKRKKGIVHVTQNVFRIYYSIYEHELRSIPLYNCKVYMVELSKKFLIKTHCEYSTFPKFNITFPISEKRRVLMVV